MTFETLLLFCLGGIALCVFAVFALETLVAFLFDENRTEPHLDDPLSGPAKHRNPVDFPAEPTLPHAA